MFTDKYQLVPFSIGYKKPTIVLSKDLVNSFSRNQLEVMLAHELAHIRRKDNAASWLALILRDILFFNPAARKAYRMLEIEKEKACDRVVLEKTKASPKLIANTLLDVALFYKNCQPKLNAPKLRLAKGFLYHSCIPKLRVDAIMNPAANKKSTKARFAFKTLAFIALLYPQFSISFTVNGHFIFLR